ncbi:MAG: nitroreductase family protein [Sphingobacteriaceae bacterium]|nr:nitroreductase family protein [Sphingobacteriaceae bacterium]
MSIKIAKTKHDVIDVIKNRWSARSFSDKTISETDMHTLFEAASWAFSANNAQPWEYIYAHREDSEAFHKLHSCLMGGNQPWTKNAAVLMAVLAHKKLDNGHENKAAKHDVGSANATLMLQATSMNIYGHVMGGFDANKAIDVLNINTEVHEPVVFIALGYLDEAEKLEEPFKTRELTPRTRKPLVEIIKRLQ